VLEEILSLHNIKVSLYLGVFAGEALDLFAGEGVA
jgi:hypothetical protein